MNENPEYIQMNPELFKIIKEFDTGSESVDKTLEFCMEYKELGYSWDLIRDILRKKREKEEIVSARGSA